ncbi:hypothetical protein [Nakamurella lactea]|uniref:hypothetical protein n=1 Tax=Nakamurella lactea TaxID=459515 RepID=UPI000413DBD8|nr:hypothetical protein [Nakamurella lactea]
MASSSAQVGPGDELTYIFGGTDYSGKPDVDVDGDGTLDGIRLDFDGSGHRDSIAYDSDGDGAVDTILVSSRHDGTYDTAYYDHSGNGAWDTAESVSMQLGPPDDEPGQADGPDATGVTLSYSFGDSHTPTQIYTGLADTDVDGDGVADGIALDFDGSGHRDAVAYDSDGDGTVDTILVSSKHDGTFDVAYHDPAGNGHWNLAEPITGDPADARPAGTGAADDSGQTPDEPTDPAAGAEASDPGAIAGADGSDHRDHPGRTDDPGTGASDAGDDADPSTVTTEGPADQAPDDGAGLETGYQTGSDDDPYAHLADDVVDTNDWHFG